MKNLLSAFLMVALFSLTGCFDVIEEMDLNRDGSGKYTLTFDMSGLFTDPFMKEMMESTIKEQGLADEKMEVDTVVYLKNAPDSLRKKFDRPDFLDKIVMRSTISESKKKMVTSIELDFDEVSDIDYFYKNMEKLGDQNQGAGGALSPGSGFMPSGALFTYGKKKLSRLPAPKPSAEQNEEMEMVKMFLGEATYKTIYHLPGKVKKATMANAEIDGQTVVVTTSYLDLIDGKAKLAGEIRFK